MSFGSAMLISVSELLLCVGDSSSVLENLVVSFSAIVRFFG